MKYRGKLICNLYGYSDDPYLPRIERSHQRRRVYGDEIKMGRLLHRQEIRLRKGMEGN